MNAVVKFDPKQVALIKQTVAKDANDEEFNLFVEMCKARGLNPLTRQVYCFIFNKDNPKKPRQMTIVVSRDGQRSIAERTGAYRPDERAPRFEYGKKDESTNPLGLVSAEVTVYKHVHGEWFPVPEVAYWEEYAPIKEIWENKQPTGKFQLDPKKDGWRKMARIMLAKCFSSDTEVLTSAGFQKFSELSAPVMQVTDAGLEPVSVKAWAQQYDGDMVTLNSDDLNFSVTPNHDMVTTCGKIEAQKLYDESRTRAVNFIPRLAKGRQIDAEICDEALVLAASYLSDGHDRSATTFVIPVSRERKVRRLRSLSLHDTERTERTAGNTAKTEFREIVTKSDKTVFTFKYAAMGGLCHQGKQVDVEFLTSLSQRQARIFVDAWVEFDGTTTSTNVQRFYCSNKEMLGIFELAACLAGKSVSHRRARTSDISERQNYYLSVSNRDAIPVIRWGRSYNNISKANEGQRTGLEIVPNASGVVWCVSVPSETIIVRRNGFSMICGNCAEMAALRKAFPDDFGGLYGEGELDRGEVLDLTPSEMAEKSAKEDRLARIGGPDTYIIDWMDGGELMSVPGGKLADQVMAFIATCEGQPSAIRAFRDRNRVALQQFWANHKSDALALRNNLDEAEKKAMEADVIAAQDSIPSQENAA